MTGLLHDHLPVLPVLLPLLTAALLLVLGDGTEEGGRGLARTRAIALVATTASLVLAMLLVAQAAQGGWSVYRLGDWPAPFGIVLVVDRLSALMVLLTQLVALPAVLYAGQGWDARGRHFHAVLQLQLMGLNGAFVTGDVFNLFVFFEVLLIASYVLVVHGQGRERFRFGVPYVVLNLAASGLFLLGVALLYAVTGTLNLADLAQRVEQVPREDLALLRTGGVLLLVVFGFKAALLPLHLWLPGTYAAAGAPVAALFAVMTKVGAYAILRVHGVVFGDGAGEAARLVEPWLLPVALASSVVAVLGALAAGTLQRLAGWLTIGSVGTVLAAFGLFTPQAWSAGLYYLVHSTLVAAALFLLFDLLVLQRGAQLEPSQRLLQPTRLGILMLVLAASVAGLPPLPGFLGKLMILQAAGGPAQPWVWAVLLGVGFLTLLGLARAGSIVFWSPEAAPQGDCERAGGRRMLALLLLTGLLAGMVVAASPLQRYADAAAAQLLDREGAARAVLGEWSRNAVRPYPPPPVATPAGGHR
ncbi:MAG TPA: monovalent cation/H+ antiporter subunit D [Ramlibacter sp.]|nr:monovalent cation/H+ antiporter subunit D [Ramlibacter sp.]